MKRPQPVDPMLAAIIAERRMIVAVLADCGVPSRDLDDALQECIIAAWLAVREGRYRPLPSMRPRENLRAWLRGIAWRQATHWTGRACNRHEVLSAEPREDEHGNERRDHGAHDPAPTALDLLVSHEACERISAAIATLPAGFERAIHAMADEQSRKELAADAGLLVNTASSVVRHARALLQKRLRRAELAGAWSERRRT